MPKINLKSLKNQAKKEIEKTRDLKELNEIFNKYLGKKGEISQILRSLGKLPKAKRVKIGKEANAFKEFLKEKFDQKTKEVKGKIEKETTKKELFDITVPGKKLLTGHLHPLTQARKEMEEIFQGMGFSIIEGPEVETEWYNFDALNVPLEHPTREMQDTLFIKQKDREKLPNEKKLLMRTHTSPNQVHYMEKNQPPLRIIIPGRVFRHEATDPGHDINFYHIEGLMVDKRGKVSTANFKAVIEEFARLFFRKKIEIRLRPSFFPFTEPSFEIDFSCSICGGKGCSTCKNSGWLEVLGAGMVHPNVFKNSGLNPKDWQGFAFGMGIDRPAMIKYKITDIRLFYSGDLRFLQQF